MKENLDNFNSFGYTGFFPQFEKLAKISDSAVKNLADNTNIRPTDWRIWLPRAFYMDWSEHKTWQKASMDLTIWFPMAFYPQEEKERALQLINIAGDTIGKDKDGENKEVTKQAQQLIHTWHIHGDYIGHDKAGENMIKDSKARGHIAGESITKPTI